jgi:hypothetical protein
MTKAEETRLQAWRLRVVQQAGEGSRGVARTWRRFGISRQAFCPFHESTPRIVLSNRSEVKGFCKNVVPGSSTP